MNERYDIPRGCPLVLAEEVLMFMAEFDIK